MVAVAFDTSPPFSLLVLSGDGIGPEVTDQTLRIVSWFKSRMRLPIEITHALVGGASIDAHDTPIADAVVARAKKSHAVLFGAVGGAQWDALPVARRPEAGLIRLRRELDLFVNLRPAVCYPELTGASSLHAPLVEGLDLLIIRELTSGVYFGQPRGTEQLSPGRYRAFDTQAYTSDEIERVVHAAFRAARGRSGRLCSVDKANVMETGRLWRQIADEISCDYPDVELTHMYADNCVMQLMRRPKQFDVIVTDNLFGDMLSDVAAMLTGSLGLLPSASLAGFGSSPRVLGLYEPVHGSAPDIAGKGIANPLASVLSFGMCLRYSMGAPEHASTLDEAVRKVLEQGTRTADIASPDHVPVSGAIVVDRVLECLEAMASSGCAH